MNKLILALLLLTFPAVVCGEVLLSEDFNNCSTGCETGATAPMGKTGYTWHNQMAPSSWEANSVTHSTGEISSSGRGGSGMSLKTWRQGTNQLGSDSYSGTLLIEGGLAGSLSSQTNFWFRYYVKIPVAFDPVNLYYMKLFRFNGSLDEFGNVNINWFGANPDTGTRGLANLQMMDWAAAEWVDLLSAADTASKLWDGEWHCMQFHFDLVNHQMQFYLDGVLEKSHTSNDFSGTWGGAGTMIQHLGMGNVTADTWGTNWVAMEIDDVVIATTKAETDPESVFVSWGTVLLP